MAIFSQNKIDMPCYQINIKGLPKLLAKFEDGHLTSLEPSNLSIKSVDLSKEALELKEDLQKYVSRKLTNFRTKIHLKAKTSFQLSVWQELLNIPYGQTRSYQDIAESLGDAKKARAVGNAVNKNPILIIIPCHRVIGKNGSLVGFAHGLKMKQTLLDIENCSKH